MFMHIISFFVTSIVMGIITAIGVANLQAGAPAGLQFGIVAGLLPLSIRAAVSVAIGENKD